MDLTTRGARDRAPRLRVATRPECRHAALRLGYRHRHVGQPSAMPRSFNDKFLVIAASRRPPPTIAQDDIAAELAAAVCKMGTSNHNGARQDRPVDVFPT